MYQTTIDSGHGRPADRWVSRLSVAISPIVAVAWLLLLFLAGCATETKLAPPPVEIRSRLGTVAVVVEPFKGVLEAAAPARRFGGGAAEGAGEGAMASLRYGLDVCDGLGAIMPPACLLTLVGSVLYAPVGALIGAVKGAGTGYEYEKVDRARSQIRAVLDQSRPAAELRRRFLRLATEKTNLRLVDSSGQAAAAANRIEGTHDGDAAIPPDSRIEINIIRFALVGEGGVDPDLSIELVTRARIVVSGEAGQPYLRRWRYSSPKRNYFEAAEGDPPALQSDLEVAFEALAEKMVFDLLLATEPEIRRGEPKPGTAWTVEGPAVGPKAPLPDEI